MKMFVCELDDQSKLECFPGGGGGTCSIHDGEVRRIFLG